MRSERARAKINLTLHVGAPVTDTGHPHFGYHPLTSLVVFADIADEISCEKADATRLTISGPFAHGLTPDEENLVLRAYVGVAVSADVPPLHFHLTKNLPIAAGIGGGSADAAATLRLLQNYADLDDVSLHRIALELGADVPVCLGSQTAIMRGIGDDIEPCPDLGSLPAVLVNPGFGISTAEIFSIFDHTDPEPEPSLQMSSGDLLTRSLSGTNDLEPIAMTREPMIGEALRMIATQAGCQLARMSGSGATCFGIFERSAQAEAARMEILEVFPEWWVQTATLGDTV